MGGAPEAKPAAPEAAASQPVPNPLETARSRESLYKAAEAQLTKLKPDSPKRWQLEADLQASREAEGRGQEDAITQALQLNDTLAKVTGSPLLQKQAASIRAKIEGARREARNQAETNFKNAKRSFIDANRADIMALGPNQSLRFQYEGKTYRVTNAGTSNRGETLNAMFVEVKPTTISTTVEGGKRG